MEELVIDIDSKGTVESMHSDKFPLGFLGEMEINRASEITFNIESQDWEINILDKSGSIMGRKLTGFAGYDAARTFEVDWLQQCRKQGVDNPCSAAGLLIANCLAIKDEDGV